MLYLSHSLDLSLVVRVKLKSVKLLAPSLWSDSNECTQHYRFFFL